jgi:hypothetical protein
MNAMYFVVKPRSLMAHIPVRLSLIEQNLLQEQFERWGSETLSDYVKEMAMTEGELFKLPRMRHLADKGFARSYWFNDKHDLPKVKKLADAAGVSVGAWVRGRSLAGPRKWPRKGMRAQDRWMAKVPKEFLASLPPEVLGLPPGSIPSEALARPLQPLAGAPGALQASTLPSLVGDAKDCDARAAMGRGARGRWEGRSSWAATSGF